MFSFITEVIGGCPDKQIIGEVRKLRREMLSDRRVVRVTDLGAGSTVLQGSERSIRQIASVAALPAREVALLARIAASLDLILERVPDRQVGGLQQTFRPLIDREANVLQSHEHKSGDRPGRVNGPNRLPTNGEEPASQPGKDHEAVFRPGDEQKSGDRPGMDYGPDGLPIQGQQLAGRPVILELGTSLGISTLALAMAAPDRRVITVEGCPELAATARENLRRHGASNTEVLNMEFSQAISYLKERGIKVGMAFIDGNHRGKALINYTQLIREMGDEMVIVADDVHLNSDMTGAWKSLYEGLHNLRKADSTTAQSGLSQTGSLPGKQSQLASTACATEKTALVSSPHAASLGTASLETFRLGILFCLRNLTPGHYRIRY
jgi:predicted O-methyltransferase YrrM